MISKKKKEGYLSLLEKFLKATGIENQVFFGRGITEVTEQPTTVEPVKTAPVGILGQHSIFPDIDNFASRG